MSFKQGLVSVLLPVLNGERYLAQAIESVLAQKYKNLELVIFDDFSTDRSLEIIEKYAALDSRINYWRSASRQGVFQNYNQCLEQAQGEFIKPFAQDDLLNNEALSRCVRQFEANPSVVLVSFGHRLVDSAGVALKVSEESWSNRPFRPNAVIQSLDVLKKCLFPLANNIGEASAVMYRAAFQGAGFDSRFHQYGDIDYFLRILLEGDFLRLEGSYVDVRRHPGCVSVAGDRGIMGACDLIKLSRKFQKVIQACGETQEHFLDMAIAGYVDELEEQLVTGGTDLEFLRRADDILSRANAEATVQANATATAAFSALATALAAPSQSCLSFSSPAPQAVSSLVQDLIDFREFTFHALRIMARGKSFAKPLAEPLKNPQSVHVLKPKAGFQKAVVL